MNRRLNALPLVIQDVLREAALAYPMVTADDILGAFKTQSIANARLFAYHLLRERFTMSHADIGRVWDPPKDHTTVLQGIVSHLKRNPRPSANGGADGEA